MADALRCPQCASLLPADSVEGLCPQCLLRLAVVTEPMGGETLPFGERPEVDAEQDFGPYHVVRILGEGGMGTVYLAEQQEPIRRLVALKVIKLGMSTREVIARFDSERQALAMMDHPHIARVFDAGASTQGRPYFVMEHVDGIPITEYCDRHRLNNRERIELFVCVCQAVHHAHQKGIIHRDIKPSNVLVGEQDGKPFPKVIDFGIAKAIDQRAMEQTAFTELGKLVGTPEYMSPEQAGNCDLDTATDVYSLGVLLYELLVGVLPIDPKALRKAGFDEIRRIIQEEETPRPTDRLRSLGAQAADVAVRRATEPGPLEKQLRGDLDWITMKAMEKDRRRRYASASEFSADIVRHLRDEPVMASPPSAVYRARKFVRKHRGSVVAMLIAFLCLVLGVSLSSVVNLVNDVTRQFESSLKQIQTEEMFVRILVVDSLNENRHVPLRVALHSHGLQNRLSDMLSRSSTLEVAVVDPQTNEILVDSSPDRIGAISPRYADFKEFVFSTSWYNRWQVLRSGQQFYQVEERLGEPPDKTIVIVRLIIASPLLRNDISPVFSRDASVTLLLAVFAVCVAFLLSVALLWLRN